MYAVGVGDSYVEGVNSDFTVNFTDVCSAPAALEFTNLSNNGNTFTWLFGDGFSSNSVNPSHTYNSMGNFDVTLIADGGECGVDTMIKTNFISIDSLNSCIVIMPTGNFTETSCYGILYDNGGLSNYADDVTSTITIQPDDAGQIILDFVLFDIEPGDNGSCNYDYVEIFDGPNTSSPSLGKFCNTTGGPTAPISSSGGSITILHYADQASNEEGFIINWSCSYNNVLPYADFSVEDDVTCSGSITFIEESYNFPTSWLWNFIGKI
jgi:PKD repeat protein